jgi:hypothetical protein
MRLTLLFGVLSGAIGVFAQSSGTCNLQDPQICVINGQDFGCPSGEECVTGCFNNFLTGTDCVSAIKISNILFYQSLILF